jgi:2-oxoisovalerate dehydrogenase E1 component beta subunit
MLTMTPTRTQTMLEAIRETIAEEMARDERVIVIGEDVGRKGGVFKATDGLAARFGEERLIDAPLAEGGIVGVAIGAALNGLRPIAEIQFADFIWPAMDQIVSEAARLRYRTNGDLGCPLVIRAPFGGGIHGALYHSQSVEALFFHVPGLKICVPATPADAKGLLTAALRDPDPVLFFEHKKLYRSVRGEVPEGEHVVPLGQADLKRAGDTLSIITYGAMVHLALDAAEQLAREGISADVLDLRSLAPLDRAAIAQTVEKTSRALVLHEDTRTGGVGAEIAAILSEELFDHLDAPVIRVTGPDVPAMPYNRRLEQAFLPQLDCLLEAARKLAAY